MAETVLDASALLALLNSEPGASLVASALPSGVMSTVNLSEVVAKLGDAGLPEQAVVAALEPLPFDVVPFSTEQAYDAGLLRPSTKQAGLSMGDRACLSLARSLNLPALTADRNWQQLEVGVEMRVIR